MKMKKRVLVIYYSQTGQLKGVLESMLAPLAENDEIVLDSVEVEPGETFSFPWSFWRFFDAFPETVYLDGPANRPLGLKSMEYDLIILGYQPWFLSPSLPISAFLQSDEAHILLKNKPVITVIGCRNMWIEAQKTVKTLLEQCGARLIDNVVFSDQSGPLESFITTPRWMLSGKKDPFFGLSRAGINEEDIRESRRFGERLVEKLSQDALVGFEPLLQNLGAVRVDPRFIASEKIGKRSFRIWGKLVRFFGERGSLARRPILAVYVAFLITLIMTIVPLNMAIQSIIRRLFKAKMDIIIRTLEAPSGR